MATPTQIGQVLGFCGPKRSQRVKPTFLTNLRLFMTFSQTVNQLLIEMDGFDDGGNVVVLAATNRADTLDSALTRAERFSSKVVVGVPDEDGRRKIFGLYLQKVPMEEDKQVICDIVASRTEGLVGADLKNFVKVAVRLAGRRGGDFVTMEDILQALERATKKDL